MTIPAMAPPDNLFLFLMLPSSAEKGEEESVAVPGQSERGRPQREFPRKESCENVWRLTGTEPFKTLLETLNWSRVKALNWGMEPERWLFSRKRVLSLVKLLNEVEMGPEKLLKPMLSRTMSGKVKRKSGI